MSENNPIDRIRNQTGKSLSNVGQRIIILSGKGGVGKTSLSVNLAASFADKGKKACILDIDIHGPNVLRLLHLQQQTPEIIENRIVPLPYSDNLSVVSHASIGSYGDEPAIWRGPIKSSVIRQLITNVEWGNLDCLIIDAPPGTGDETLTIAQLVPPPISALLVTTPQDVAIDDVKKAAAFCNKVGLPIVGIVENMSGMICPQCSHHIDLYKKGGGKIAAAELGISFLGEIPFDPQMVVSSDKGVPFVLEFGNSPAAMKIKELVSKLPCT